MRWINLEPIIQSEVSQKEKDKYRILTRIYGIQKNDTEEFIYRAAVEKDIDNRFTDMGRGEERVRCQERVTWELTLPYVKQISNGNLLYSQETQTGALYQPRVVGWEGRWEGGSGWGTHVHPWLINVNVWQKPLQYFKVISLQLK